MSTARSTPRSIRRSTRSPPLSSSKSNGPAHKQHYSSFALDSSVNMTPSSQTVVTLSGAKTHISEPPPLPSSVNPLLANFRGKPRSVKIQDIALSPTLCITIARVKVPTPADTSGGHLIKRFDTDAISASSFFKTAFPHATEEEEATHMKFLEKNFDTLRAAGDHLGPEHRLTGTWVPVAHAEYIAQLYGLTKFASSLISFANPAASGVESMPAKSESPDKKSQPTPLVSSDPTTTSPDLSKAGSKSNDRGTARSSKRSRIAPPSFDNTSPSHFSLKTQVAAITVDENEPTTAAHDSKALPTMEKHAPEDAAVQSESEGAAMADIDASNQLIGTDEVATKAQEEATNLVARLRETASIASLGSECPPGSENSRKRGIENMESEGLLDSQVPIDEAPSNFFARIWRSRRTRNPSSGSERIPGLHKTRSIIDLPGINQDEALSLTRRNLAVAGIVVAGAAA